MRIAETKVYSFEELNPEAQSKAIEEHRNYNVDGEWWHESIIDDWKEKLAERGFPNAKIYFSGFWSQGDGACFDAEVDWEKFLAYENKQTKFRPLRKQTNSNRVTVSFTIDTINNHYSHERTRQVAADYDYHLKDIRNPQQVEQTVEQLRLLIEERRLQYSQAIYKDLEQEYEYQTADEQVKDALISNEIEFTEDGKTW